MNFFFLLYTWFTLFIKYAEYSYLVFLNLMFMDQNLAKHLQKVDSPETVEPDFCKSVQVLKECGTTHSYI